MDLTASIEARSDQINADDFVATGPVTFTVSEVVKGKAEQPFDFMLAENGKAYRPGVIMRRLIVAAWGPQTTDYAGRRLTLYRDPNVPNPGTSLKGGIRISHMSNIAKRVEVISQVTRGKREKFTADPLPDAPAAPTEPTAEEVAACVDAAQLKGMWDRAVSAERREQIRQRKSDLDNEPTSDGA
jgi:hypothetical protein